MTPRQALAFVEKCGIVLESARSSSVLSLAATIAGEPIQGSWWGHSKGDAIFVCSRAIRRSQDILTCRLIDGKVTYVHRRLWPALVKLSGHLKADRLAPIREIHTAAGKHRIETAAFSQWVSPDEFRKSASLSVEEAIAMLESAGITGARPDR
jgi:hypothetical protein